MSVTKEKPTVKDILLVLSVGALVIGSIAVPGLPRILYYLTKKEKETKKDLARFNHRLFRQELKRLAKRGVVKFRDVNGETVAELTELGTKKIKKYELANLKIIKPKKWDSKWRIVIFDISDRKKVARELLRQKLKELGFYRLQESVFIYPFPCTEEIMILREELELTPEEVMYLTVEDIEGEHITLRNFKK